MEPNFIVPKSKENTFIEDSDNGYFLVRKFPSKSLCLLYWKKNTTHTPISTKSQSDKNAHWRANVWGAAASHHWCRGWIGTVHHTGCPGSPDSPVLLLSSSFVVTSFSPSSSLAPLCPSWVTRIRWLSSSSLFVFFSSVHFSTFVCCSHDADKFPLPAFSCLILLPPWMSLTFLLFPSPPLPTFVFKVFTPVLVWFLIDVFTSSLLFFFLCPSLSSAHRKSDDRGGERKETAM